MNNPKISIIIPVYNVEKYLQYCLDSIIAQTFTDWECICVDDGSSDASGKILDEYAVKDKRFVIIHKENGGVSSARNAGLDIARGEYVTFCDSDDWIEADCFEYVVGKIDKSDISLVQWGIAKNNEKGNVLSAEEYPDGIFNFESNLELFCPGIYNKLIKRSLINDNKIRFPEGIRLSEDRFFSFLCFYYSHNFLSINRIFYHYIQNSKSVTHNTNVEYILDEKCVIDKINKILIENKEMNDNYNQFLISQKITCKCHILYLMPNPDFELWRTTYPEVNQYLYKMKNRMRFVNIMIINKQDFLASIVIKIVKILLK